MKVATFNCNSVRKRLPLILEWLEKERPDLMALQETKVQDKDFPVEAFRTLGYHVYFRGIKNFHGVATLTREEASEVIYGLDSSPKADEFRIIQTLVKGVRVINTYVPQGTHIKTEAFQYKLQWFGRLRKYFDKYLKKEAPIIWLGDLNCAPEEIDVAHPKRVVNDPDFHIETRKAYKNTVDGRFIDVYRMKYPKKVQYTFWDFFRNAYEHNRGWRIDHILATPDLAKKCTKVVVDLGPREKPNPSDHTIVWAEFKL